MLRWERVGGQPRDMLMYARLTAAGAVTIQDARER